MSANKISSGLRKFLVGVRETLLTLAALGGVICIVLVVLAFTGGYSLIMFKTGSMSPTIPAGSVALVKEIEASEFEVGDVLTVDREGELPVTHRVTSIAEGPTSDSRSITMRGDDNDVDDAEPYVIEHARIVVGSVPQLANVIVWFGNPLVMGGITIGAGILVTWAFWPRSPKPRRDEDADGSLGENPAEPLHGQQAPAGAQDSLDEQAPVDELPAGEHSGDGHPSVQQPRARHGAHALVLLVAAAAVTSGVFGAGATPAQAAGELQLRSDLEPGVEYALDPVEPLFWHIDVDAAAAPADGELEVSALSEGDAALGMRVQVESCAEAWEAGECASGSKTLVFGEAAELFGSWKSITSGPTPATVHLRIALTAEPDASATGQEAASLTVRATAGSLTDEVTVGGGPELPRTGAGVNMLGLVLAPAAVLGGILVAWLARSRRRATEGGAR